MSTVYIIKDGIIVDSRVAFRNYHDSRGITVKPDTEQEEKELIQFSDNNKKIKKLKEQLEELEGAKDTAGLQARFEAQGSGIRQEQERLRQEKVRQELSEKELQNAMLEKVKTFRRQAKQLEELLFCVETSLGEEQVEAQVDLRTKGELTRLKNQTEEIAALLLQEDEKGLLGLQEKLEQIGKGLLSLPEKAKEVFNVQIWRPEQVQMAADRLQDAGWQVTLSEGKDMFDPIYLAVANAAGKKAVLTFSIDGEVRIDSHFADKELQKSLQQTVLGALAAGGAKKAAGQCMDNLDKMKRPSVNKKGLAARKEEETGQAKTRQA